MYDMNYIKLGQRIKEERLKRQLTQEKMAENLDVSASYLGQIERGERNPTLDTLVMIANNFGVTVDYLLRDSLKAYREEDQEEWNRLIEGRTSEEKRALMEIVRACLRLGGGG
jgi:transcriptional regulator with XRE-family HTH domain